jgi:hypothetical protein
MTQGVFEGTLATMPFYLLHHRHGPDECAAAFASWQGYSSPLRHHRAPSTCLAGGHAIWWQVEARDRQHALALLPEFVARRTEPIAVRDVQIP